MTIPRLRSLSRSFVAFLACAVTTALLLLALGAAVPAHAARGRPRYKSCDISDVATKLGPTTVTSLKVLNVRCATGI